MSFSEARAAGVLKLDTTDDGVPTMRSMVLAMDGVQAKGATLDTVVDVLQDDGKTQTDEHARALHRLGLVDQLMHTVASPAMAYLLFVIGAALLIFEFFTAGVGIAGMVGAVCLDPRLLRPGRAARHGRGPSSLLVLAMFAFAIDVQVGVPRFWTGVGHHAVHHRLVVPLRADPGQRHAAQLDHADRRHRRGDADVHRRHAVDGAHPLRHADDRARVDDRRDGRRPSTSINPEGIAVVGAARWRARTNRATPIAAGDGLRVVAIDGVTLEVEPLEGAARDYRERAVAHAPTMTVDVVGISRPATTIAASGLS